MFRIMLVYGAIAGVVIIGVMLAGMAMNGGAGSMVQGYLTMLVVLSLIFVGIKRHRDKDLGGVIKFLPALGLGVGIAAVAGVFYVLSWEASLQLTDFAWMEDYEQRAIAGYEAKGLTGEELAEKVAAMEAMMANYTNPLFRLPITFLEIFPVGLVVALVSAALLRNPKVLPAKA
ncbi:MAG: DUF4199 domain-containing protein [Alphaproteobacteria bacterium]|nr:DUF4199 domain-containing protein [Henriciella sp.]MBO6696466.1 DUF4199 domain-containing protein [Henriciella sp.]MCH9750963.1 DUF4199 domain-containing protein [Alphaproteobacteria bacterium]